MALAALLLAWSVALADPGYPRTAPPADFRGIAFGAPLDAIADMSAVADRMPKGKVRFKDVYYRENENLDMAGIKLVSVAYYFRDGLLRSVVLTTRGEVNAFKLKDLFISKYGPGRQVGLRYGWTWPEFSLVMTRMPGEDITALEYTLERVPGS